MTDTAKSSLVKIERKERPFMSTFKNLFAFVLLLSLTTSVQAEVFRFNEFKVAWAPAEAVPSIGVTVGESADAFSFGFDYEGTGVVSGIFFEKGLFDSELKKGAQNVTFSGDPDVQFLHHQRLSDWHKKRTRRRPMRAGPNGWTGSPIALTSGGGSMKKRLANGIKQTSDTFFVNIAKQDGATLDGLLGVLGTAGNRIMIDVMGLPFAANFPTAKLTRKPFLETRGGVAGLNAVSDALVVPAPHVAGQLLLALGLVALRRRRAG